MALVPPSCSFMRLRPQPPCTGAFPRGGVAPAPPAPAITMAPTQSTLHASTSTRCLFK